MSSNTHTRTFSTSSSTLTSRDANGNLQTQEQRSENRSIDGVSLGHSEYRDSLGNERRSELKGLGGATSELVSGRNADGRSIQAKNIDGLPENEQGSFDSKWNQAAGQVGLSTGSTARLEGNDQKQIK